VRQGFSYPAVRGFQVDSGGGGPLLKKSRATAGLGNVRGIVQKKEQVDRRKREQRGKKELRGFRLLPDFAFLIR